MYKPVPLFVTRVGGAKRAMSMPTTTTSVGLTQLSAPSVLFIGVLIVEESMKRKKEEKQDQNFL